MNEDSKPMIDPELETRIVAMVLGEASDFETEQLRAMIAERPELAAFEAELLAVDGLLRVATEGDSIDGGDWKLPEDRRASVLAVIDGKMETATTEIEPPKTVRLGERWKRSPSSFKVFAAAAVLAFVMFGFVLNNAAKHRVAFTGGIDPSSGLAFSDDYAAEGLDIGGETLGARRYQSLPNTADEPTVFYSQVAPSTAAATTDEEVSAGENRYDFSTRSSKSALSAIRDSLASGGRSSAPEASAPEASAPASGPIGYFEDMAETPQPEPQVIAGLPAQSGQIRFGGAVNNGAMTNDSGVTSPADSVSLGYTVTPPKAETWRNRELVESVEEAKIAKAKASRLEMIDELSAAIEPPPAPMPDASLDDLFGDTFGGEPAAPPARPAPKPSSSLAQSNPGAAGTFFRQYGSVERFRESGEKVAASPKPVEESPADRDLFLGGHLAIPDLQQPSAPSPKTEAEPPLEIALSITPSYGGFDAGGNDGSGRAAGGSKVIANQPFENNTPQFQSETRSAGQQASAGRQPAAFGVQGMTQGQAQGLGQARGMIGAITAPEEAAPIESPFGDDDPFSAPAADPFAMGGAIADRYQGRPEPVAAQDKFLKKNLSKENVEQELSEDMIGGGMEMDMDGDGAITGGIAGKSIRGKTNQPFEAGDSNESIPALVENFNELVDEGRLAEANVIAEAVKEIAPDSSIAANMFHQSQRATELAKEQEQRDQAQKEQLFAMGLMDVDRAASVVPGDSSSGTPMLMPDPKTWHDLSLRRPKQAEDLSGNGVQVDTETQQQIREQLKSLSAATKWGIELDGKKQSEVDFEALKENRWESRSGNAWATQADQIWLDSLPPSSANTPAQKGKHLAFGGVPITDDGREQPSPYYLKDDVRYTPPAEMLQSARGRYERTEATRGSRVASVEEEAEEADGEATNEFLYRSTTVKNGRTIVYDWYRGEREGRIVSDSGSLATVPKGINEKNASDEAFSTFSLHVSDVAFKLARAALAGGTWPEVEKVRIEEFVNAFDYGDPMPTRDEKVACRLEQAAHPFLQQRNLLRVSMRTAAAGRSGSTPLRLTLLLDNSGSMERLDRQQTVRRAFALLAAQLKPIDQVTLISFARTPRLLAEGLNGAQAQQLVSLIEGLPSEGGTNLEAALQLAFEKAKEQQVDGAQNRIILLTDGAVNLGNANPDSLSERIITMRRAGIAFDAAGISANGLNDEVLEALTRKGDGRYYLLDSIDDCDDGFAKQIAGALRPAAKNVKIQVEFNPRRVGRYKLLGFEKHRLKKEDFRNDKVDAAEMAAEEAGVAMYQFEAKPDGEGDIGSISVRFRDLSTGQMVENRWPIPYEADTPGLDVAPSAIKIAGTAALLAAKLRGEPLGESVDLKTLAGIVASLPPTDRSQRVDELQNMIQQARQLSGK
ncbi:MAG: von Willebrand factor type A domain-containing protein [Planctomycetota bacterium]